MRKILFALLLAAVVLGLGWKWSVQSAVKEAGWTWDEGVSHYYVYEP